MLGILGVVVSLVVIEGLLSVDNAMVIAAMVSVLPARQRTRALNYGLAGAYIGRGIALAFASYIMEIKVIRVAGALYLVYMAVSHLMGHESEGKAKTASSFMIVVRGLILADLAFSVDNILAAVALSPKLWVVVTGVFAGMLAMRFVSGLFVRLMEKKPVLKPLAYILVGYVGMLLLTEEFTPFHVSETVKTMGIALIIITGLVCDRFRKSIIRNPIHRHAVLPKGA